MLLCLLYASVATAQFKLYEKGHDAYTSGQYIEAIKNFSEYLTKGTRDKALDVDVFYLRALSYYKTNQYKEAIGDFQETLLLDHQNKGNFYWFMAKAYDKTNSLNESGEFPRWKKLYPRADVNSTRHFRLLLHVL